MNFLLLLAMLPGEPADGGGGIMGFLIPLILIFAVFYFFIIRPQKKREQEHQEMVSSVEKGDKIVTIGGMHGTVKKVNEDSLLIQVDEAVKVRLEKSAVSNVADKKKKKS